MKKILILTIPLLLTACVTMDSQNPNYGYSQQQGYNQYQNQNIGKIVSIRNVQIQGSNDVSAPGVIIGGIVGGLLGNQIGGGKGKTLAAVAGAAGGAYVGNEIAKKNSQPVDALEIQVRQYNGQIITVTQPRDNSYFRNGDTVVINTNSNGQVYLSPR